MYTMSHTGSSGTTSHDIKKRVLKKVGITSTTFIGPAFPPTKRTKVKSDIEDTLSEFYKELEKIDTPDGVNNNPGKQNAQTTSTSQGTQGVREESVVYTSTFAETDGCHRGSGQKQPSWSHWYQNEPYYPRRPRPPAPSQNQWRYPQTPNRPTNPGFHRPPFHRPPHPSAFPDPHNPPPHMDQNWRGSGMMNQPEEESHFPTFSSLTSSNASSHPSQGFYGDSLPHFDRDERGCKPDVHSDIVNGGWSRERKEELPQFGEHYDSYQRYDSESEPWASHCQPPANTDTYRPPLVLILMRGLPGSGKSTLARKLLSTGPSGLILSTDDYFAHKEGYHYEAALLGAAHEWNHNRAQDAMHDGRSPIIIDNTNAQAWEMKPYVKMALERGYKVDFCEPDTSWKFDPYELEKRNMHGVLKKKIAQMKDRFSFPISVDIVMSSQEPPHSNQRRQPEQPHRKRTRDFH
ncbi:NEDD4-binding protein 2-like 2 [Eleginops maclovinus]